jgi:hypothetical protein
VLESECEIFQIDEDGETAFGIVYSGHWGLGNRWTLVSLSEERNRMQDSKF